jgi:hypothetical protein
MPPMYVQCRSHASPIVSCDQSRATRNSRTRSPKARFMLRLASLVTPEVSSTNTYISRDYEYYFCYYVAPWARRKKTSYESKRGEAPKATRKEGWKIEKTTRPGTAIRVLRFSNSLSEAIFTTAQACSVSPAHSLPAGRVMNASFTSSVWASALPPLCRCRRGGGTRLSPPPIWACRPAQRPPTPGSRCFPERCPGCDSAAGIP